MFVNLMAAIKARGFHSYEVARAVHMSESRFSRCLSGRGDFEPEERKRIAQFLNVSEKWLFEINVHLPLWTSRVVSGPAPIAARAKGA